MLYAQIIVKQRTQVQELTYGLSAQIIPYIKVGSLVTVPLRRKSVEGVVVGFSRTVNKEIRANVREIVGLVKGDRIFSTAQIGVVHKLADYYAAPLAEVAFHALDTPSFWPSATKATNHKPLMISGSWRSRQIAYQQIITKSTGRILLIFALQTYAAAFREVLKQSKEFDRIYAIKDFSGKKKTKELAEILRQDNRVVLIGTPGDIFSPLQLGDTILVDQPYHIGAKSNARPFMTARRIALVRGVVEGLQVVLGDTLVSLEDLLEVKDRKFLLDSTKITPHQLTIIDRRGQHDLIAPSLMAEIESAVKSNQKILVLVMARGWASAIICQDCGQTITCQNCQRTIGVGMFDQKLPAPNLSPPDRWRNGSQKLPCLYCATVTELPRICSQCRSTKFKAIGEGVSAVKSELVDQFPGIKIQELSGDQPILDQTARVVVATEKIFSFPDAMFDKTFIISADRLLSGTHLDGTWRLLGYLIELQSRSREIRIQTYFPDSSVWTAAATGNVRPFFSLELSNRKKLYLPPYGTVITIRGSVSTTEKLSQVAEKIKNDIAKILPIADISLSKVDDRSAGNYHGSFSIYYPKLLQHTLRVKLASLLPPAWHLDFEK